MAHFMKIKIVNLSSARENDIRLLCSYYAATFAHLRNEIWMEDLTGERLRTLNDQTGVMMVLEQDTFEKWSSFSGVYIMRDHLRLDSSAQLKFARTILLCQQTQPTIDGLEFTYIFPFYGVFKHTQQESLSYD